MEVLQERRRLNEEIERAYIRTVGFASDILLYRQTERGISDIDLYEHFYGEFSYLTILVSDVQQMRNAECQEIVDKCIAWVMEVVDIDKEGVALQRCESGMRLFMELKKVLADQGVIALPPK